MEGLILGVICLYTHSACIRVAWKELMLIESVYFFISTHTSKYVQIDCTIIINVIFHRAYIFDL